MAIRDQTTVVEMRAMVPDSYEPKLTPAKVEQYPFRDIDTLTEVLSAVGSVQEAAHRLDCRDSDVRAWAEVYGLDVDALLVGGGADV